MSGSRGRPADAPDKTRRLAFRLHPDWQEFMEGLDHAAMSREEVCAAFEGHFGVPMRPTQVTSWRMANGRADSNRSAHRGGVRRRPLGFEREDKDGYILRKVREEADVPCTKDNWVLKQQWVWEQANGRELPEGHVVYFADGDCRNFDPSNLVAVPRSYVALINGRTSPGYHDAETLRACVEWARLVHAAEMAERRRARRCYACGREFTPDPRQAARAKNCRECLEAGRAAKVPRWRR